MGTFLSLVFLKVYKEEVSNLDQELFAKMRFCSFDLKCSDFEIDFTPKKEKKPLFLYHDKGGIEAYFLIPNSTSYFMKLSYSKEKYQQKREEIQRELFLHFLLLLLFIGMLSLLFSFYALYPMKKGLLTVEEFIKDILHDFNTPISSIILNTSLLKKDDKNREKVMRIDQSAQRILSLQENLKSYLLEIETQKEHFDVLAVIKERQKSIQKLYPHIEWEVLFPSFEVYTHKAAFERIIVNLLSNAAKYNKQNGKIKIDKGKSNDILIIEDTGIGIKNPQRVFERFYTENSRGTGIGLHIVQKLCEELKIGIKVTSSPKEGSRFILKLGLLTQG
jgi:signal transduction histidine kinase